MLFQAFISSDNTIWKPTITPRSRIFSPSSLSSPIVNEREDTQVLTLTHGVNLEGISRDKSTATHFTQHWLSFPLTSTGNFFWSNGLETSQLLCRWVNHKSRACGNNFIPLHQSFWLFCRYFYRVQPKKLKTDRITRSVPSVIGSIILTLLKSLSFGPVSISRASRHFLWLTGQYFRCTIQLHYQMIMLLPTILQLLAKLYWERLTDGNMMVADLLFLHSSLGLLPKYWTVEKLQTSSPFTTILQGNIAPCKYTQRCRR